MSKRMIDKAIPYIVAIMMGVTGFMFTQLYNKLDDKPTKAEVECLITTKVADTPTKADVECLITDKLEPVVIQVNANTTSISSINTNLTIISSMSTTIDKIDSRTIKQGEDIAEIKGKLEHLK